MDEARSSETPEQTSYSTGCKSPEDYTLRNTGIEFPKNLANYFKTNK
jgi:hypothetical protein